MTPCQVRRVYFHPRKDDGRLDRRGRDAGPRKSPEYWFREGMRLRGIPEHRIDGLWAAERARRAAQLAQSRREG